MVRSSVAVVVCLIALGAAAIAHAQGRCGDRTCRADVSVSGHAEPQPIKRGELSEFKFSPMNNGEDGALKIDFQVTIPNGLKIVSVKHFGGNSCTTKGTFVQCDMGDFASQQMGVVRIRVQAEKEGTYLAPAKVYASDIDDPNGGNNQVTATLLVNGKGGTKGSGQKDAATIKASDPQSITRTRGLKFGVYAPQSGTITSRAEVITRTGRLLKLTSVKQGVEQGKEVQVFLPASSARMKQLRAALPSGRRLRTIIRVTQNGQTTRREIHVRR